MLISIFPGSSISIPLAPSLRTSSLLPDKRGRCPPKLPARMWPVLKQPVQWHVQHAGSNRADLLIMYLSDDSLASRLLNVSFESFRQSCFKHAGLLKAEITSARTHRLLIKRDLTRCVGWCSMNALQRTPFNEESSCKVYTANFTV